MYKTEQIKEWFKNHKATVVNLSDDVQILTWAEPGTIFYKIDYLFYKNMIYITGDLRDAVFNTTWYPKWDTNWLKTELSYFAEKISATDYGKYEWDSEVAIEIIKEHYTDFFDELSEEELNEMFEEIETLQSGYYARVKNYNDLVHISYSYKVSKEPLLQYCLVLKSLLHSSSKEEFVYNLQNDPNFDDYNDFWEWGYDCGQTLNGDIQAYLIGLQMAYAQLKEQAYSKEEKK